MTVVANGSIARIFHVDDRYDRVHASDGFSRFGAQIALRLPVVLSHDPQVLADRARWGAFTWATATMPVMTPGYVQWIDPIEDIRVECDDGDLAVEADVRICPPALQTRQGREWTPPDNRCASRCDDRFVLSKVTLRANLVPKQLVAPPREPRRHNEVTWAAKAAVRVIATALEARLAPAIPALSSLVPRRLYDVDTVALIQLT